MNDLNKNLYKELYNQRRKDFLKLLKLVLKHLPREDIIKELKRRKIIKRDWLENGEKYEINKETN
jgi:uncharacterized membrane protein